MSRMEDYNYYGDSRVRAGEMDKWYQSIRDETYAVVDIERFIDLDDPVIEKLMADPTDESVSYFLIPIEWVVCYTCNGKGSHVNPAIDCGGLTSKDFYDDPEFADGYHSGVYDVPCYECNGRRVTPEPIGPFKEYYEKFLKEEADHYNVVAQERRMGA